MIIGIAGCSRAGKSTLADLLTWEFRIQNKSVFVFHIDDFVKKISEINKIQNQPNWESSQSINTKLLIDTIGFYKKKNFDILIIEGFHLLSIETITKLCDFQIVINLKENSFFERRKKEVRWGFEELWYLEHVWKTWNEEGQKYLESSKQIIIEGEKPFEIKEIIDQIKLKI